MSETFTSAHGIYGAPPIGPQVSYGGRVQLEAERQKIRKILNVLLGGQFLVLDAEPILDGKIDTSKNNRYDKIGKAVYLPVFLYMTIFPLRI